MSLPGTSPGDLVALLPAAVVLPLGAAMTGTALAGLGLARLGERLSPARRDCLAAGIGVAVGLIVGWLVASGGTWPADPAAPPKPLDLTLPLGLLACLAGLGGGVFGPTPWGGRLAVGVVALAGGGAALLGGAGALVGGLLVAVWALMLGGVSGTARPQTPPRTGRLTGLLIGLGLIALVLAPAGIGAHAALPLAASLPAILGGALGGLLPALGRKTPRHGGGLAVPLALGAAGLALAQALALEMPALTPALAVLAFSALGPPTAAPNHRLSRLLPALPPTLALLLALIALGG
ncbi:hypothetical protein [Roseospirillum parvum]|uniref:Uncharacterized protein n=1 Tax=Roseospirillum parvum TaxID=83401 RepID=A0A1G7ZC70_9PROT|nr:hypothetical protein [Roseospirillum parvum]SDH06136.1 hypothetical protein SAMN05421742_10463 [Roseospirillum parvum]